MDIIVSYDSDAAKAPTGFKACVNAACQYLDALLTSPITVHIDVGYGTIDGQTIDPGALGESEGSYVNGSYSSSVAALKAAIAPGSSSLPTSVPNGDELVISTAQARALGLSNRNTLDGYVGFDSTASWYFDPTQSKAVPFNSYDFMGTFLHEVTEVLGRVSFLDEANEIGLLDLFRYASAGTLQTGTGDPSYFSTDGGITHQLAFNNFQTGDQGDLGDWATANGTNDSFNDDSYNGTRNLMSSTDKIEMQAIGFTETASSQALSVAGAVPQLSAAAAVSAVASGQDSYVAVVDSGAGVSAALDGLETLVKGQNLSGISLSGGSVITLSIAQMSSDSGALAMISGSYSLSVADSAANIQADLATLQSDLSSTKLTGAAVTDSSYAVITVTPSQLAADKGVIDLLTGNFTLTVDATASMGASITGPSGHGTVVELPGSASQYSLTPDGNGVGFTETSSAGSDHISNITALSFGGTLDFVAASPGTANAITDGNITELYGAVFGREPDVPGLAFYQAYLKANPSVPLTSYAFYFVNSAEYKNNSAHAYAETSAGDAQFITDSYANLLHRTPSSSEVTFYQNVITPFLQGQSPGTAAYQAADLLAHAQVLTYFSQSAEFLGDVQITAQHPADSQHWLYLI
jgi:hypothetical protein